MYIIILALDNVIHVPMMQHASVIHIYKIYILRLSSYGSTNSGNK